MDKAWTTPSASSDRSAGKARGGLPGSCYEVSYARPGAVTAPQRNMALFKRVARRAA